MRAIDIVIPDLYLPHAPEAAADALALSGRLPGLESAGRFAARAPLAAGWRAWLTGALGRADLGSVAPARVAAALLAEPGPVEGATCWIATPLQLTAGLSRVHLDHRGILALSAAELAALGASFARTFGADGLSLRPLPSGDLLLSTPGIAPLPTVEPGRVVGSDLARALPQGGAAAPLRRLVAELEMWLHGQPLNEARVQRREAPVTTLWLWGAEGHSLPPRGAAPAGLPLACGRDAWLEGLWRFLGGECRALPGHLEELLGGRGERAVLIGSLAEQLQRAPQRTVAHALARLDELLVMPALQALRRGRLSRASLIVNDVRLTLGRASCFKLWRRRRAGLEAIA